MKSEAELGKEARAQLETALRFHEQGEVEKAIAGYQAVVGGTPDLPDIQCNLGTLLKRIGRLDEAESCYDIALQFAPEHVDAWFNRGNVRLARGDEDGAAKDYEMAVSLNPADVDAWNNLAHIHESRGEVDEAIDVYKKLLENAPQTFTANLSLGMLLGRREMHREAVHYYDAAARLNPDHAQLQNHFGISLHRVGELQNAIEHYEHSIRLDSSDAETFNNLGAALSELNLLSRAVEALEGAIRLDPKSAFAFNNLGICLDKQGERDKAHKYFLKALELLPEFVEANQNLGKMLAFQGHLAEAEKAFREVARLNPARKVAYDFRAAALLPVIAESNEQIRHYRARYLSEIRSMRESGIRFSDPQADIGETNFYLAYHGLNDCEMQRELAEFYLEACPGLSWRAPHCDDGVTGRADGRIRIGIASAYLHGHSIGKLGLRLIEKLPRDRFEVVVFRQNHPNDAISQAIESACDKVVHFPPRLADAREAVAKEELDVLYHQDIGMNPMTFFMAFAKLAPVQCVTWGHPVTTGIPTMDYFFSTRKMEPDGADRYYTEQLIQFESLPTSFPRPEHPQYWSTRIELGLPDSANLYVCPQSLFKLHPDFDLMAGSILRRDPSGVLVLISGAAQTWDDLVLARFKRINPDVGDRVVFVRRMSPDQFMSLLKLADVIIDPPHFSGGVTTQEALSVGTPIVTLPGEFMRGRVTYGCYSRMDYFDCVATNESDYVEKALRLALDGDWRKHVEEQIVEKREVLFENRGFIDEAGDFFSSLVRR